MTLDKCIVLRIGTLTGCPLCRESHPLCRLKNPTVISIWLLVGFHPATRSVQCTPADNARKRAPGSIYRKKQKESLSLCGSHIPHCWKSKVTAQLFILPIGNTYTYLTIHVGNAFPLHFKNKGAQWLSGRVLDSRPKGHGFEPHRRHCVVVLEQDTFILA